jgi:DNA primase large subunit
MEPRHARYPFLSAAREAVESMDVTLGALVTEGAPAVARGAERVERALLSGTVAPEDPGAWSARDELLSYPVARILVSLLDSRAAVRKYAAAEAATARERFTADVAAGDDDLRSVADRRLTVADLLAEFDLDGAVRPVRATATPAGADDGGSRTAGTARPGGADADREVALGAYLRLADPEWGDRWRLVNRAVADGWVRVRREELDSLLEAAVRRRVAEGLPFDVRGGPGGEAVAEALDAEVSHLRGLLADRDPVPDVDRVAPDRFPPCVTDLLSRVDDGETLPPPARFALLAFLADLGFDADDVRSFLADRDAPPERLVEVEFGAATLGDGARAQYPMPSCATMDALGLCVDADDRCETVDHPVGYYAAALEDADGGTGADGDGGTGADGDGGTGADGDGGTGTDEPLDAD